MKTENIDHVMDVDGAPSEAYVELAELKRLAEIGAQYEVDVHEAFATNYGNSPPKPTFQERQTLALESIAASLSVNNHGSLAESIGVSLYEIAESLKGGGR